ncbi:MAG TPA: pilus assembly protein TadG-related protein, partial [Sinorhizobium sp.]|nr:pilus assembly protein TadG-related protein [Sinorhizobium sp.]
MWTLVNKFLRKRAFGADRKGATAIIFAVSLPVLVGGAGLGVEVGYWHLSQRELQTAADLAANAGAVALRGGASDSDVYDVSLREADENGFEPTNGVITVNTPP